MPTPAQLARIEGFTASLAARGVILSVLPVGPEFRALIEPIQPFFGEHDLDRNGRTSNKIGAFRSAVSGAEITVGTVLRDATALIDYRVKKIDDHPANVVVTFEAEPSEATAP